jgi:hypothetical protein
MWIQTPASRSLHAWTDSCLGLLPDGLKITWFWDLAVQVVWKAVGHTVAWLFLQLNTLPGKTFGTPSRAKRGKTVART